MIMLHLSHPVLSSAVLLLATALSGWALLCGGPLPDQPPTALSAADPCLRALEVPCEQIARDASEGIERQGHGLIRSAWLDGDRLAVGAPDVGRCSGRPPEESCDPVGAVYVFERSAADSRVWRQTSYLEAPGVHPWDDGFGYRVSLCGNALLVESPDVTTCAPGYEVLAPGAPCLPAGAVFRFRPEREGRGWKQVASHRGAFLDPRARCVVQPRAFPKRPSPPVPVLGAH